MCTNLSFCDKVLYENLYQNNTKKFTYYQIVETDKKIFTEFNIL